MKTDRLITCELCDLRMFLREEKEHREIVHSIVYEYELEEIFRESETEKFLRLGPEEYGRQFRNEFGR